MFDSPFVSFLSAMEIDLLDFLQKLSELMHENDKIFITSLMVFLIKTLNFLYFFVFLNKN